MRSLIKISLIMLSMGLAQAQDKAVLRNDTDSPWRRFVHTLEDVRKEIVRTNSSVARLKTIDLKNALNFEAGFNLRNAYGRIYLEANNLKPATESFYIAKTLAPKGTFDPLALDESLLALWLKRGSDLSVKHYIENLLKAGFEPDKRIFDEFITNRCITEEDYALLKSAVQNAGQVSQESAYLFSRAALKFADIETSKKYLARVTDKKFKCLKDYMLGTISVKLKNLEEAFGHFDRCSKESATEYAAVREASIMAMARLYIERRKYDEAIEKYLKIERSSPFYSDSLYELSYAYYKKGRFKSSLEAIDFLLLSEPSMKLFLDSMRIKGKGLIPANYSDSAIESYNNLIMRMEYEKTKLKEAETGYYGSENEILEFLDSSWVERPAKSMPSSLMIKALSSDDPVRRIYAVKKEMSLIEEEIKTLTPAIEYLKKTVREGRFLPSLEKTYNWLGSRQREALSSVIRIARSMLDLLNESKTSVPESHIKTFRDIETEIRFLDSSPSAKVVSLEAMGSLEGTALDLTKLEKKVYDLNGLLLSGWGIMDGERETVALSLKRKISEEYRDIGILKDESISYLSDIKTLENKIERYEDLQTIGLLNQLLTKAISALSSLARHADPVLKKNGEARYEKVSKILALATSMSHIPSSVAHFTKALRSEESSVLKTAFAEIRGLESEIKSLSSELSVLKSGFESATKPGVRLAFARIKDSFGIYIEDYGWGLANSNFEKKKEIQRKIKDLMLLREAELSKIERDFAPVTHEQ